MKKLDNKQKLIWDCSAQADLPPLPNKEDVWLRLVQHMEISDRETGTDLDRQEINPPGKDIWTLVKPRLNYAIALGLALVFILPVAYESFTTETLLTKTAEYQTAHLPDGSSVSLNSESKIRYNQDFSTNHRTLALIGEAYFDVIKGSAPFIINTEYGQVTVVGTSFNVRTREDGFEVGVNEGRVDVSSETSSVQLQKGQVLRGTSMFSKKDIHDVSHADYPDWMNQKLYCDHTPLSEVCSEIERTFGISIEFSDPSLNDITVTGVIDAQDLKTVLSTVSLLTQHEFKLDGDTCTII